MGLKIFDIMFIKSSEFLKKIIYWVSFFAEFHGDDDELFCGVVDRRNY